MADLFGQVEESTFVGDNLAFYIKKTTGTGMVINGAIRDLEGIAALDLPSYFRGVHPGINRISMVTGVNVPVRIGNVTVMPGDVVFGEREGVYFIPPQFVSEIVQRAQTTRSSEWTKMKFATGQYKTRDIYSRPTSPELIKEYEEYLKQKLGKQ